jgi:hypothetical protein
MQHEHRTEAMDELAAAVACIRRAGVHLVESGDIDTGRDDVATRSMSGVITASERWCVEALVAINARMPERVPA